MRDKAPDFAGDIQRAKKSVADAKRVRRAFEAKAKRIPSKAKARKKKRDI